MPSRNEWELVVRKVISVLNAAEIDYHLDASSSLFIHGINFDMDDLDITVRWGAIERVRVLFDGFCPTELSVAYPPSFKFKVDEKIVHVMSYKSETGLGEARDRVEVKVGRSMVWSKTLDYYEKNMKPDHPLKEALRAYNQKVKL